MSQQWFPEITHALSLVSLWRSDRQNGFHRRAEQITAALLLSWLTCWTEEIQRHLHSFLLFFYTRFEVLFVFWCCTTHEIIIIIVNLSLSTMTCLWLRFTLMMTDSLMGNHHSWEQEDQGSSVTVLSVRPCGVAQDEQCSLPPMLIGWNICWLCHFWHVI